MLAAGKWVLGIVPAGIALGALLGNYAAPYMEEAPAPFWRLGGENAFIASLGTVAIAAAPGDLSPAGGYRPDLDYDAEVWGAPIAGYELVALIEEPLPGELPTDVSADEAVADEAEAAAEEATAADVPEPEAAPEPDDARRPELVGSGLY